MRLMSFLISLAAIFLIISCGEQQQKAIEDITATHPENTTVIFDNEYVKAVEFMLKPGEKLPLHQGQPRAIYALSDYEIKWTEGNTTSDKKWQKGEIHWHDAMEHAIENIGDTDAHYLVVSRKPAKLPETGDYDLSQDASAMDPEHSNIILENDHVRIIKTTIPPQESQTMHQGINRLIYALSDYQIKYTSDKAEAEETQMAAGNAHWHGADEHAVENIGTSPAEYLIFEFKK